MKNEATSASGEFRLLKRLGSGGMAEVFLAERAGPAGFRKKIVIKRLHPYLYQEPDIVKMFLDEARVVASLNHPNICQLLDLGIADGEYFITLEHLVGKDLAQIVSALRTREETMPLPFALQIVSIIARALCYAHEKMDDDGAPLGIVHRDVTPSNVFICRDGSIKLLDFGVAKSLDRPDRTMPGTIIGKLDYLAPEQCLGAPVDPRTDIYALGLILYESLTGRLPVNGLTATNRYDALMAGECAQAIERCGFDPAVASLLNRLLAPDPDDRVQSASQLEDEVLQLATVLDAGATNAELIHWMNEVVVEPTVRHDANEDLGTMSQDASLLDASFVDASLLDSSLLDSSLLDSSLLDGSLLDASLLDPSRLNPSNALSTEWGKRRRDEVKTEQESGSAGISQLPTSPLVRSEDSEDSHLERGPSLVQTDSGMRQVPNEGIFRRGALGDDGENAAQNIGRRPEKTRVLSPQERKIERDTLDDSDLALDPPAPVGLADSAPVGRALADSAPVGRELADSAAAVSAGAPPTGTDETTSTMVIAPALATPAPAPSPGAYSEMDLGVTNPIAPALTPNQRMEGRPPKPTPIPHVDTAVPMAPPPPADPPKKGNRTLFVALFSGLVGAAAMLGVPLLLSDAEDDAPVASSPAPATATAAPPPKADDPPPVKVDPNDLGELKPDEAAPGAAPPAGSPEVDNAGLATPESATDATAVVVQSDADKKTAVGEEKATDNRKARSRRRRARRASKKTVEVAPGFITIDARPWARVTIGGKDFGVTPVKDIEWPRGSVTIVLERKDLGVIRKETIRVKSGQHTRRRFSLE